MGFDRAPQLERDDVLEEWCIRVFPDEVPIALTQRLFLRGDVNGNGEVAVLTDALSLLRWIFLDGADPPCLDAADVNDNGTIDPLIDALVLIAWAFTDGATWRRFSDLTAAS